MSRVLVGVIFQYLYKSMRLPKFQHCIYIIFLNSPSAESLIVMICTYATTHLSVDLSSVRKRLMLRIVKATLLTPHSALSAKDRLHDITRARRISWYCLNRTGEKFLISYRP